MDKREELTQIVRKVQKDIGQFELLYTHIINKVYFWCYTIVKNEAVAQDLAQESMITIYQKLYTLKSAELFSPWMYAIVRNKCYQYFDSHKRKDRLFLDSSDEANEFENMIKEKRKENLPKEAYDLQEIKQLVKKFIDKLPKKQREVIILFYLEEMKINEIAETLDYKVGSVKSRLHSGRKNLESQIREYEKENEDKLYCVLLLPILMLTLREYCKEICEKQNLAYDESLYKSLENPKENGVLNRYSKQLFASGTIVVGIVIIVTFFLTTFPNSGYRMNNMNFSIASEDDEKNINKASYNSPVESISFLSFPTRTSVEVTVVLKEELKDRDVKILFNGDEVAFDVNNQTLLVRVKENGRYEVILDGMNMDFDIDVIDKYAPELVEVVSHDGYIQLVTNDELSQMDYECSYVEYQGNRYKINNDLKVMGDFEGFIKIRIINKNQQYITYGIELK